MTPKARALRFLRLKELGCICCRKLGWYCAPEIHHLNLDGKAGQKRRGDEYTIPLCRWHHQGVVFVAWSLTEMRNKFGPSLKLASRAFRARFGTDDQLLNEVNRLISTNIGAKQCA